jgi:hypothetical protein
MWNSDENGTPQDAITCPYPNEWYWPLGGVHVDGVAYIFVCRVTGGAANAFGFDVRGWDLLSVETDTGEFCTAHTTRIRLPATATTAVSLGGGGVWRDRDYIYAMGVSSQGDAIHARLPVESLRTGFALIEWLVGDGWSFADREPVVMLHRSHAEFSVSNLGAYGWLWVQQAPRIFDSRIVARWAEDIRGPWSPFITLHTPDEPLSTMGTPSFAYGARAHLTADSLLATYCVNGLEAANIEADLSVYFPRVVRLDLYDDAVGPPLTSLRDMFANNSE